ncbi:MAG: PEGA domain-containing protein [Gemmatimonadota bacterium]
MKRVALIVLIATTIGCTESVYIQTTPPGARVFVNNREIGVSPFEFEAPSKDLPTTRYEYRMELPGYRPAEGFLPTRVSVGRVIGSIFTFGLIAAIRGVRVFGEDQMQETLYPLEAVARAGGGPPIGVPHSRKVFFTTAPLSSLPPNSYVPIKDLSTEFDWVMAGTVLCLEEMADDARKIGADAVFEVETHQRFRPGWGSPLKPIATGKAIALVDPCATKGISGEFRPADEADTPQNRALSARCDDGSTTRPSGATTTGSGGKCSVEQVLSMKAAGLSDEQVKAACGK